MQMSYGGAGPSQKGVKITIVCSRDNGGCGQAFDNMWDFEHHREGVWPNTTCKAVPKPEPPKGALVDGVGRFGRQED